MLEPRRYPRLIGRALMLEPDAFARMADDDAPVAEGAFLVTMVGLAVGIAQTIGAFLLTWAMPPAVAIESIVARMARAFDAAGGVAQTLPLDAWKISRYAGGFDTGLARLYPLVWQPFLLLAQWLVAGVLLYLIARALGGAGTLPATLGAAALMVAPMVLQLAEVAPFLSVPAALLLVWTTLMLYRAAQVVHGFPWRQAAAAALVATALLWVVSALFLLISYAFVGRILL